MSSLRRRHVCLRHSLQAPAASEQLCQRVPVTNRPIARQCTGPHGPLPFEQARTHLLWGFVERSFSSRSCECLCLLSLAGKEKLLPSSFRSFSFLLASSIMWLMPGMLQVRSAKAGARKHSQICASQESAPRRAPFALASQILACQRLACGAAFSPKNGRHGLL